MSIKTQVLFFSKASPQGGKSNLLVWFHSVPGTKCKHQRSVRVFNMLRLAYIVIKESCGGFSFKLVLKWGGAIEPL
jgi:hypothetical protein